MNGCLCVALPGAPGSHHWLLYYRSPQSPSAGPSIAAERLIWDAKRHVCFVRPVLSLCSDLIPPFRAPPVSGVRVTWLTVDDTQAASGESTHHRFSNHKRLNVDVSEVRFLHRVCHPYTGTKNNISVQLPGCLLPPVCPAAWVETILKTSNS